MWRSSLKSLWVGEREAIGDLAVGDELSEHTGREPVHPVLLDLCTGVAGAALFAVAAQVDSDTDLFLPLGYGQVVLRDEMPRRFYCHARWRPGPVDGEVQVFDLDFSDRNGRNLGGIREFIVKRAPREALLRSLGGDTTRMLYGISWRETQPPVALDSDSVRGNWLAAGFDELARHLPNVAVVDLSTDANGWTELLAQAQERGAPVSGIVVQIPPAPQSEESSTEFTARLQSQIGCVLAAVRGPARAGRRGSGGWPVDRHRTGRRNGSRRAGRAPSRRRCGGWPQTVISEQPILRCRLVDHDGTGPRRPDGGEPPCRSR